ncbi:MAG: ABC transporter permease subunit [Labilithrix sp.]|nr:ABC transporter permease subunit [Labilithrix sp.]
MSRALFAAVFVAISSISTALSAAPSVKVGSKRFVESYILAEIVTQLVRAEGGAAEHEQGLGGTAVVFRALEDGAIDVYPEYTGTLTEAVFKDEALADALSRRGLAISKPLGFENTYALAVTQKEAAALGLSKLSDLAAHPELRVTLSHELMGRRDGWPGLAERYGLKPATLTAIDHALAYEAIAKGSADVIDVYTTDAKIARFGLTVLDDDRRFFPRYDAVLVYRADLPGRSAAFTRALARLEGKLDARTMQELNARADLDGVGFASVAAGWIDQRKSARGDARRGIVAGTLDVIARHGPRHVLLVLVAVALSTLVGVPLGVLAHGRRRLGAVVLGGAGIVQTIPSLALFCFLIPLFGIGVVPALVALFLYGLLPIVRNTHAGLASIPDDLREAAVAIGLTRSERLREVELPLASRTIVAGIKTSAVVAVGTATIAAFIGAGGFGEPISTGLSLNDVPMILEGAIPAAGLALVVEALFGFLERAIVPKGLRDTT